MFKQSAHVARSFLPLLVAVILGGCPVASALADDPIAPTKSPATERVREGTRLEMEGRFHTAGDRFEFIPQGEEKGFRLLENLNLERVATVMSDSRTQRDWKVIGEVTEYQGLNFLLLHHAVIRTATEAH
ncbi:hypothetical protein [Lignipirellula cremea]|uniref:Bacterial OB-fold domain-containing protein n=1 Tax=Lignipirellula cremea TaxID=2528010 RepID=A0A518DP01_9BACT|nr:hypothetical protein [Lignipirellula cremea]QDU93572.1 hypothetical protein Pla8534_13520 [Lignipirellula cremea]